jgi:LuxR family maltose regulon positive regulatory protein
MTLNIRKKIASKDKTQQEVQSYKYFPPPMNPRALLRHKILNDIFELEENTRTIIFQAPAGYGKSTCMQQVMQALNSRGWETAWFTCDRADNDPKQFETNIFHLFLKNNIFKESDVHIELTSSKLHEKILELIFQNKNPIALFFDEYQLIYDESIKLFFTFFLQHLPQNIIVFIGTRSEPDIGLPTLLAHQIAKVFNSDYLRFSDNEVKDFFIRLYDVNTSDSEVKLIGSYTEGWPAALQLFKLALAKPGFRTTMASIEDKRPRELTQYLADNVLSLQSEEIQDFLLKTSVLKRLSVDLCNQVTNKNNSRKILEYLEKSGLFITTTDLQGNWFKYHSVFSNFLNDVLKKDDSEKISEINLVAAQWFFDNQNYEEAMHHVIQLKDFNFAVEILDLWGQDLVPSEKLATMQYWYDQIPIEYSIKNIKLVIKMTYVLLFLRRRDKLKPLIKHIKDLFIKSNEVDGVKLDYIIGISEMFEDDMKNAISFVKDISMINLEVDDRFSAFELAAAGNLLACGKMAEGDFDTVRVALLLARRFGEQSNSLFSSVYTISIECISWILQGDLEKVIDKLGTSKNIFHEGYAIDSSIKSSVAIVACHLWAFYEKNEISAATNLWKRYEKEISESLVPDFMAIGHIYAARSYFVKGEIESAHGILDSLERISYASQWPRIAQLAYWERLRFGILHLQITKAKAKSMIETHKDINLISDSVPLSEEMGSELYGLIRLYILVGDFDIAKKIISKAKLHSDTRVYRKIKLNVFSAIVAFHSNNLREAMRFMNTSLKLSFPGGFVRCLIDEGDAVVSILKEMYLNSCSFENESSVDSLNYKEFIKKILTEAGSFVEISKQVEGSPGNSIISELSPKQIQILKLLSNGDTSKVIASKLFISENTVKFHLKKIYIALNIKNRSQAIMTARKLKLIS